MAKKEDSPEDSHQQVSPRNWMFIHDKFMMFAEQHSDEERFKNGFSTSNMTIDEIREVLEGATDVEFADEILDWFEKNCGDFSIEKIIADPINTPSPMAGKLPPVKREISEAKEVSDKRKYNEITIIDNLVEQMRNRYDKSNKKPIKPTDKELSNIMIWLGINFKHNFNAISENFAYQLHSALKDNGFWDFHKFGLLFMAAFPENDYNEIIEYPELIEALKDTSHAKETTDFYLKEGENMLDVVKGFAKEYFPWRLKDGELQTIYETEGGEAKGDGEAEEE